MAIGDSFHWLYAEEMNLGERDIGLATSASSTHEGRRGGDLGGAGVMSTRSALISVIVMLAGIEK